MRHPTIIFGLVFDGGFQFDQILSFGREDHSGAADINVYLEKPIFKPQIIPDRGAIQLIDWLSSSEEENIACKVNSRRWPLGLIVKSAVCIPVIEHYLIMPAIETEFSLIVTVGEKEE